MLRESVLYLCIQAHAESFRKTEAAGKYLIVFYFDIVVNQYRLITINIHAALKKNATTRGALIISCVGNSFGTVYEIVLIISWLG